MNRFCLDTPLPENDRSSPPFYSSLEEKNDKGALQFALLGWLPRSRVFALRTVFSGKILPKKTPEYLLSFSLSLP